MAWDLLEKLRPMRKWILVFSLMISFTLPVNAQVYRWTDSKGTVHFTDDPSLIPDQYRAGALKSELSLEIEKTQKPEETHGQKVETAQRDTLGRSKDYWRARVLEWRQKLARAQERWETLRMQYNELTEKHNAVRNSVARARIRNERDQVKFQMDECKAQIDEAKRMLEVTIPEEAALFRANPEWLKP